MNSLAAFALLVIGLVMASGGKDKKESLPEPLDPEKEKALSAERAKLEAERRKAQQADMRA
jgi:hypothetical protein